MASLLVIGIISLCIIAYNLYQSNNELTRNC